MHNHKMNPDILCFDLDGTLVDRSGQIHPLDRKILATEHLENRFVACTGRSLESTKRTFAKNGLFVNKKMPFPLVLLNGTLLYGRNEEFLEFLAFNKDQQSDIILKATSSNEKTTFLFLTKDQTFLIGKDPFGLDLIDLFEFRPLPLRKWDSRSAISKVMCFSKHEKNLRAFEHQIQIPGLEKVYSMPSILEITPCGGNKGDGIKRLLKFIDLEHQSVIAAGDGGNDLSMVPIADEFFVPSTAPIEVKKHATRIIDVSENGLLPPMLNGYGRNSRN